MALFAANLVARGVRLFYLAVLARLLSSDDLALFVYGLAFYILFSCLAGVAQGPFLSERRGRGRGNWARYVQHSLTLRMTATLLVVMGGVFYLFVQEGLDDSARVLMVLFLALLPRSYALWLRLVLVAMEDARPVPVFEAVARTFEVVVGIAWLVLGGDVLGLAVLHVLAWSLEAGWIHFHVVRNRLDLDFGRRPRLARRILAWSVLPTASQWMRLAYLQIGIVMLRDLVPNADLASYAIAIQFLSAGLMLPAALATAMRTSLSRDSRSGRRDANKLAGVLPLVLLGGGLIAVLVNLVGPLPFAWLLGSDYLATGEMLMQLVWILGPLAALWLISDGLNQFGLRSASLVTLAVACGAHFLLKWGLGDLIKLPVLLAVQVSLIIGVLLGVMVGLGYLTRAGLLSDRIVVFGSFGALGIGAMIYAAVPLVHSFAALCAAVPIVFGFYFYRDRLGVLR